VRACSSVAATAPPTGAGGVKVTICSTPVASCVTSVMVWPFDRPFTSDCRFASEPEKAASCGAVAWICSAVWAAAGWERNADRTRTSARIRHHLQQASRHFSCLELEEFDGVTVQDLGAVLWSER